MKRLKRIIFNMLALVMVACVCFTFTACEDVRRLEITVSIYDADEAEMVDKTLTVDLYRHLAPKTVDHLIKNCVEQNYYNGAIFYKESSYAQQIMMGDIKVGASSDEVLKLDPVDTVEGEFEYGTTVGSNLVNKEGSIGLWRTWSALDGSYTTSSSTNTGSATWFMPTASLTQYDGWFCVFAQINLNDENNSKTWNAIKNGFATTDLYEEYVIYYTGEYGSLQFNCLPKTEFDNLTSGEKEAVFEAKQNQHVSFNKRSVLLPVATVKGEKTFAIQIKGVKSI